MFFWVCTDIKILKNTIKPIVDFGVKKQTNKKQTKNEAKQKIKIKKIYSEIFYRSHLCIVKKYCKFK